ncbi:MAG: hypothetical protein KAI47_28190 [Deltaproteobacteria bacterium]|nr:hypothetical protein [Deltaproteobacteria bacterium]
MSRCPGRDRRDRVPSPIINRAARFFGVTTSPSAPATPTRPATLAPAAPTTSAAAASLNDEFAERQANVLLLCTVGRRYRPGFVADAVGLLHPKTVVAIHRDSEKGATVLT